MNNKYHGNLMLFCANFLLRYSNTLHWLLEKIYRCQMSKKKENDKSKLKNQKASPEFIKMLQKSPKFINSC